MNQEQENQKNILILVDMACETLSPSETVALNLGLLLNMTLKEKAGYEKIAHLFNADGTIHDMTREALQRVLMARVQAIADNRKE